MSTVEDRLTDALAARAALETVDAGVLRRRREDVEAPAWQHQGAVQELGATDGALGVLDADGSSPRRPWISVAAVAVAAVLVLGRPQVPSDLEPGDSLGTPVTTGSIRRVARTPAATFRVGVTKDHQLCFTADSARGTAGTCTLASLWHRRFTAHDALNLTLADGTKAWLTPHRLRPRRAAPEGLHRRRPELVGAARPGGAMMARDVRRGSWPTATSDR